MAHQSRLILGTALVVSLIVGSISVQAQQSGAFSFATPEFQKVWDRTDLPVQEGYAVRTWIWGPGANTPLLEEPYAEAPGGMRHVQYTDKSRKEMPWGAMPDPESDWFISQGLLANELMTGQLQIGDALFEQHLPAMIPVAGDPDDISGPTYQAMGLHIDRAPRAQGGTITEMIDRHGNITTNSALASYGVTDHHRVTGVTGIDKNIASVFWTFMTSTGIVYQDGEYVVDDLFLNPFYAIGYPKTDAFWAEVKVANEHRHVLSQCFERRCLTFTPGNDDGWEVESGNIGQHYYHWRYEIIEEGSPLAPTGGSFSYEGESEVTIDNDEDEVTLVAQVLGGDNVPLPGIVVRFAVLGEIEAINVDRDHGVTDSYGYTTVNVTGNHGGVAEVLAFVDLDGDGTFTDGVDFELGRVEVTVDAPPPPPSPDGGYFTHDGWPTLSLAVGQSAILTAEVTREGTPFYGAVVIFTVTEGQGVVSLSPTSAMSGPHGTATVTVTGVMAGTATIHAWIDMNESGVFESTHDVDLGEVVVTVGGN